MIRQKVHSAKKATPDREAKRGSAKPLSISKPKGGAQSLSGKAAKQADRKSFQPKASDDNMDFLAVGTSVQRGKFLLVGKGGKYVVLSVRNLGRDPSGELERLEALDVDMILPKTRSDFLRLAQEAASMQPTFKVATQIGWFDDVFVTPSAVYPRQAPVTSMPEGWSRIQVHLNAKDDDVHSRFRCSGSASNSKEIFRLCKGNSRLMFAAAFSFVGPICQPFGLRAPGVQLVGVAGSGKTVSVIIAGATWGGNPDSSLGFGSAWNGTSNGLEEYSPAHNQTLMVLDETSLMPTDAKRRPLSFGEALMRLMQGQGKKRANDHVIERWSTPLISTSNLSVYQLLDAERRKNYKAYVDRLIDISAPNRSPSFFENRHDSKDDDAFGQYLFDLAIQNFGHPSRAFLTRFTAELENNRKTLAAVVAGHVAKYKAATEGINSPMRNVQRVRGYFATVYAAGCLAIRYEILPFTEAELLDAIMSCHRDHVAFVDAEVAGAPGWVMPAASAAGNADPVTAQSAIADIPEPAERPYDRARRFVSANLKGGFLNVKNAKAGDSFVPSAIGYIGKHEGRTEYWIPGPMFREIAGNKAEDRALKQELFDRGLLVTARRGDGVSYVVKRSLPDGTRPFFVVLRAKARRRKS